MRRAINTVHNERIKLLATFMNGIAVAVFAVGGLSPMFSDLSGSGRLRPIVMVIGAICILSAFALHYIGSVLLKRMKP